jgi:hypothetical protein
MICIISPGLHQTFFLRISSCDFPSISSIQAGERKRDFLLEIWWKSVILFYMCSWAIREGIAKTPLF